jgi:thioredoxin 1
MTINDKNYEDTINSGKHVVLFWAEWCQHCKPMKDILKDINLEDVKFYSCDFENEGAKIADQSGLQSLPTMIMYEDGREISRMPGKKTKEEVVSWVSESVYA